MKKKWIYGRNVVVSGCSAGIGLAITDLLISKYGCNIMGIARNKHKLEDMKREYNGRFDFRCFDISCEQSWLDFAENLENIGFAVDIIINNAGIIQSFGQFQDMSSEDMDRLINTNMFSIFHSCKAFIPAVKKSDFGAIMNIGSASSILPIGGESVYSATKAAVWAFSQSLVQELRGYGVAVSCVMPGPVKTDIYKQREGENMHKADAMVENIGITAETAARRIVRALIKRKSRVIIDIVAAIMDFSMRLMPVITCRIAGILMKKACNMVLSFRPIYLEQIRDAKKIGRKRKRAKKASEYIDERYKEPGFFLNQSINNK